MPRLRPYLPLLISLVIALAAASSSERSGSWLGISLAAIKFWAPSTGLVLVLPQRSAAKLRFWLETCLAAGASSFVFSTWIEVERFWIGLTPLDPEPPLQTLFELVDLANDQSLLGFCGSLWLVTTVGFAALRCLRQARPEG